MADNNTMLGSEGAGESFEALGETWTLIPPDLRIKAAFEKWMKARARREVLAMRDELNPRAFASEQRRLDADFIAGKYAYGDDVWKLVIGTEKGMLQLFYLCLLPNHPTVTEEQAEQVMLDGGALAAWTFNAVVRMADPSLFSPLGPKPGGAKPIPNGQPSSADAAETVPAH